ncbi:hypothetical protein ALC53_06318 [Atta colombica]|uniref:Uncharacterized protein n=1 Tax=Atta colombica TaxID=520822 RepID=A0A195BEQ1_9HYME|nr:hypothetical protein ALC53_06318 [Atta colombica]
MREITRTRSNDRKKTEIAYGYECKSCKTPSKIGFIPGPSPGWHSGGSNDDALVWSTHKYSSMPSIPFGTVVPRRKSDVVTEID